MEQKKMDLYGFISTTITAVELALNDTKTSIIEVKDTDTYIEAAQWLSYTSGIIDITRESINCIEGENLKNIMLKTYQRWDSKLQYLEKFLEEQKPSCLKNAELNGKNECSEHYEFLSDIRVFKKSDVDDISFSVKDISQPDLKDETKSDFSAKEEVSANELVEKINQMISEAFQKKGETHEPR